MASNSPFTIKLPAKTEISNCFWYIKGKRDSCPNPYELNNSYNGQIVVDDKGWEATFYSPNIAECYDSVKKPDCKLEVRLSNIALEKLSLDNSQFKTHLESLGIVYDPKTKNPEVFVKVQVGKGKGDAGHDNLGTSHDSQDLEKQGFLDPIVQNAPTILGTFVIAIFGYIVIPRVYSKLKGATHKPSRRPIIHKQTLASPSGGSLPSVQALKNVIFEEIKHQLFPFHNEIKTLKSHIERLENKLETIALSQELHASVAKPRELFFEPMSQKVSLNTLVPIHPVHPIAPSPPAPLSVDLIKKAIASNDYSLISAYPHFFLSETPDSQQGRADGKRFTVDGDQLQASSKTQSEFIAINCKDDTYLIPNIVPNAADPARTLKRHADKNNIYRNGQGGNFLNIDHLAVVQRNGDLFDLKKPGQIN